MQDLAGLLIVLVVDAGTEPSGEHPQRLLGHSGIERKRLQRGDDAVAPKQRCVPRHAGRVEPVTVEVRGEQSQIEQRPAKDAVDEFLIDVNAGNDRQARRLPRRRLATSTRRCRAHSW